MGTPVITAVAVAHGVDVTITNLATAASGAASFELWRSGAEQYWRGRHTRGVEGTWWRLRTSAITNDTFTDYSPESGTSYSYRVRAIGDTVATADSSVVLVSDFTLDPAVYLVPAASSVLIGSETDATLVFRLPQPGQSSEFITQSERHLFAGRRYPVVEFGLHDLSRLAATVRVPYSDGTNGYGTELDLLRWERDGTVLLFRDARGMKAYGVIQELAFTNTQWGREATFVVQPVDYDDTVAA